MLADVEEQLQDLNSGDRDDRAHQLELDVAEIEMLHPGRPARGVAGIDA